MVLLSVWASGDETSRLLAFVNIHTMASILPYPFIDLCLKGAYLTFVRHSRFYNRKTMALVSLMCSCVVELYKLDTKASYQHAFVYIRQLAIHLRNAIVNKTKEAHQAVYNWQYINSLRVWVRLLSQSHQVSDLALLLYPLVQIMSGSIRLLPTARNFPLRFQVHMAVIFYIAHARCTLV